MRRLALVVFVMAVVTVGCAPHTPGPRAETAELTPPTAPRPDYPTHGLGQLDERGWFPEPHGTPRKPEPPSFFGVACPAPPQGWDIVYVIDRSGSMLDTFDVVRKELARSLSRLDPRYRFHIIFFADGDAMESPPGKLVVATDDRRLEAWKFVETVQPQGRTGPIPALKRAFEVLKEKREGNAKSAGQIIYLLTDGEFPDNDKVIAAAKSLNPDKTVKVHTILHVHKSPAAEKVLTEIAEDSGGTFKFVPEQE